MAETPERSALIGLLDKRCRSLVADDGMLLMDDLRRIWQSYITLPSIKNLPFTSAQDDELRVLVVGFRLAGTHEGLLHLEASLTLHHSLWADCPNKSNVLLPHAVLMTHAACTWAPRLLDAQGRFTLEPAGIPVLVRVIEKRKDLMREEVARVQRDMQARQGDKPLYPSAHSAATLLVADLQLVFEGGVPDFERARDLLRVRQSRDVTVVLRRPEWRACGIVLKRMEREVEGFMEDVEELREAMEGCEGFPGFEYVQGVGGPKPKGGLVSVAAARLTRGLMRLRSVGSGRGKAISQH